MKYFFPHLSFIALLLVVHATGNAQVQPDTNLNQIDIHIDREFQVIENFGASDAWACQFAGLWPESKKNAIADLLFSTDTLANGNPKGIGLSLWRFNIGAGSAQQGDASGIKDLWRRAESFLEPDGSYNWNRQSGQVWFLKAAKQRGVGKFLAFLNSAPVNLTKNKKAYSGNGKSNIDSISLPALATYISKVLQGVKKQTGIEFNYISPVNEPQWDWSDGGQEGGPYNNKEIADLVKTLSKSLNNQTVQILVPEAGHLKYLLADDDKPGRGNQIETFFDRRSAHYLGDLPNISKTVAAHSYFSTSPQKKGVELRTEIASRVSAKPGIGYWQSEYCILGDNNGDINGDKRDLGIDAALYVADVIHADLVYGNATAWQWWLALSPYDYKDGLIYIDKNVSDGNIYQSKMLWALGNYSRFIRPGMKRISADIVSSGSSQNIKLSAYKDAASGKLVLVAVNRNGLEKKVKLPVFPVSNSSSKLLMYTTSSEASLARQSVIGNIISIPPRSITTLVLHYK